jgi:hypothetical protein
MVTLGGNGRRMHAAVNFAEINGFEVSFTRRRHLRFLGHGGVVVDSGMHGDQRAVWHAIARMKFLMKTVRV